MKACICTRYGGPEVLKFKDIPTPEPKAGEVRVRIFATSVTSGDSRMRGARFPKGMRWIARPFLGFAGPRQPILGTEIAGIIDKVGGDVSRYRVGDAVMAFPGGKMGCHAEYCCVAENGPLALKPDKISFAEAATLCFGGSTALHFLDATELSSGDKVLIIGASGAVGTALVQLARHRGAHVTAVCSARNVDFVRDLGADDVVDYMVDGYRDRLGRFDVIFETSGSMTFRDASALLKPGGRFAAIAAGLPDLAAIIWAPGLRGRKVIAGPAEERPDHVHLLAQLAEDGVLRPVIDRYYAFDDIASAHAYVDTGRKRGSVSIVLAPAARA